MINLAAVGLQSVDQKKGEHAQGLYEGCIIKCLEVRPARPTPRMITEGVLSVAGRDDLPALTRDEVEAIYVAMIAIAHKEFNERPE